MKSKPYGQCPTCGEQCWIDASDGIEPNMLRTENHRHTNTDYGPGENWTEVYKCPKCGTEFKENNGFP